MKREVIAQPTKCPVCGNQIIVSVPRKSILEVTTTVTDISGILFYQCENGHVFPAQDTAA